MSAAETVVEAKETHHLPVLEQEVLEFLGVGEQGLLCPLLLDGTVGGGGHSSSMLRASEGLFVVGVDADTQAVERSKKRLQPFSERVCLVHGKFFELEQTLSRIPQEVRERLAPPRSSFPYFQRVLLDLGISSDQLDDQERGFSFSREGPLDMRIDRESTLTADKVVNSYDLYALRMVFQQGGVGPGSRRLADAILKKRPIQTTKELAAICQEVLGVRHLRKRPGKNLATVPFQAIRIEVNRELVGLHEFLDTVPQYISSGGRIGIISFHSLEDRLVTQRFRSWEQGEELPSRFPGESSGLGRLLTKKPVTPTEQEIETNPRARSARLRVFEWGEA